MIFFTKPHFSFKQPALDHHLAFLHNMLLATINVNSTAVLLLLFLFLLTISFVVSGAEVAFFSLSHKDINLLKTKQQYGYRRIVELLEEPKVLLGALVVANSFVNIGIIIIANILFDEFVVLHQSYQWVEFLIKVVTVTFILVLFGEIMPKVLATQNNIRFAKDMGPVIEFVYYIFSRPSKWLGKYSDIIERKLSNKVNGTLTNEELYHAIDITDTGTNENEKNILKGILKFGNITVRQIMRTRLDVHGINYNSSFEDVVKIIEDLHYSRLPIYKDDLDEIAGMLHTKDVIPYLNQPNDFDWHTLIRPPYFVHEQRLIEDLLKEFQAKRIHFAVVVDEFGGTSGIVTLEDIMEEVIGDIRDEFDEDDASFKKIDDRNYIFEGRTAIVDVCNAMNLPEDTFDKDKGESDSLAGLVLEVAGDIPKINDPISCGDIEFTVLEKEKNRLQKIKVTIVAEQASN